MLLFQLKKRYLPHLNRIGLEGTVIDSVVPSTYKINYKINGNPLVSILIPNKDHVNGFGKVHKLNCRKKQLTIFTK